MGAYGAMNIGTRFAERFGVIAALGGPVDLAQLLLDIAEDGLEVAPQEEVPREVGEDFTFDHQPPYPDRRTRLSLLKDLMIAFGNPFLHHPDPARRYLASDSEPARLRADDEFGSFEVPSDPRGFLDGGDANSDGLRQVGELPDFPIDVLLLAGGSLARVAPGVSGTEIGGREVADLNGDRVFDVGDGIVRNASEPFRDRDGNGLFDPLSGETFDDFGLDGVAGTGDFGEANGAFDEDPDRVRWAAEDPSRRLAMAAPEAVASQRIYLDVGTRDEFGFARHYDNLVAVLEAKGLDVDVREGFDGSCFSVPEPRADRVLVRYRGGHVGIPNADEILDDLDFGDICGALPIWQRLLGMIGFMEASFPGGVYGLRGLALRGDFAVRDIAAPSLAEQPGDPAPVQRVAVYRPPAFLGNHNDVFPVVYFLGGYGQSPEDFARVADLLDLLITAGRIQHMAFAFLPGRGGVRGSFYVNHAIPEAQVPDAPAVTSGRYQDAIVDDLIPAIERDVLAGRVRR
jgi:hypothetical protein